MTAGVRSINLGTVPSADEVIVHKDGSLARLLIANLISQMSGNASLISVIEGVAAAAVEEGLAGAGTTLLADLADKLATQMGIAAGQLLLGIGPNALGKLALGSEGKVLRAGPTAPAWQDDVIASSVVATTSGAAIDFTGIPAWATQVSLNMVGVSTAGTSQVTARLGTSTGVVLSGYAVATNVTDATSLSTQLVTSGFTLLASSAANVRTGTIIFRRMPGTNTWLGAGEFNDDSAVAGYFVRGKAPLAGALDRVRLTTIGGTDAFDAGSAWVTWR